MDKSFDFEGCNVNIIRKNKKVVVGIEYGMPMSLVCLMGFIEILGRPLNFCYEPEDKYVLFMFNDKDDAIDIRSLWESEFKKSNIEIKCKPTV